MPSPGARKAPRPFSKWPKTALAPGPGFRFAESLFTATRPSRTGLQHVFSIKKPVQGAEALLWQNGLPFVTLRADQRGSSKDWVLRSPIIMRRAPPISSEDRA